MLYHSVLIPGLFDCLCLCAGATKFDASQYAFFGNNAVEEVELGGLEDDDGVDAGFVGPGDEEYPSAYGRDMFEVIYMTVHLCLM